MIIILSSVQNVLLGQHSLNHIFISETKMLITKSNSILQFRTLYALITKKPQIIYEQSGYQVCDFQRLDDGNSNIQCVVVVNNKLNIQWLEKAINCSNNIVLADGGANRFYQTHMRDSQKVKAIVGDFDSLQPKVRQYYSNKGVQLTQVWNQDTNDFEKAVKKALKNEWNKVFCFGAFGGRMDHTLSSMHNAQKLSKEHQDLSICLFGQHNLMYFLRGNIKHKIIISKSMERNFCGLIPFGNTENIVTKGFKWNLGPNFTHRSLKWGDFISTSNYIQGDTVEIESANGLFFVSHFRNTLDI